MQQLFGLFLSIIPSVLNSSCYLSFNVSSVISIIIFIIGLLFSYYLGDIKGNNTKLKRILKKDK